MDRTNKEKIVVRKLFNAELDQRNPSELLGILLKTAEIAQDDPKWEIWER